MRNIAFFIILIISNTTVLAQAVDDDLFSLPLEELLKIDITGSTLTVENHKTVPSTVTIFTHKEIQRMGLDYLDELMNIVPGFQSYRTTTSSIHSPYSLRGRRIGGASSEILVLVDGQRLESPRSSGSALIVPKYTLEQVKRIEFIRGPNSSIYGSNAMLGVINIITMDNYNSVSLGYGSFNRRKANVMASEKLGDVTIDMSAHIEADNGDTYRVQDTFSPGRIVTDDPRELANLNAKLRWHDTYLNVQHYQFRVENFYELGTISNASNEREGRLDSISIKQDFNWNSVKSWFWLSQNHATLDVSTQALAAGALAAISNPPSTEPLYVTTNSDGYSEIRTQLHNDWKIDKLNSLQFGVEYRYIDSSVTYTNSNYDLIELANGTIPVTYYGTMSGYRPVQKASERNIAGIYGQYQHKLSEETRFTMGLRYDYFSEIGKQLSPRFGIVTQLNPHQSLKLLYGKAYRAPAENELNLLNNPAILGNPDLKPETVNSGEIVWVGQWPATGISLCYFENHFHNSIVQADNGTGILQYDNVDLDPTKGIEVEVSHEISTNWLFRATYTYMSEKPDLSFREADKIASVTINYQQNRLNGNLIAIYHGERETPIGGDINNRITLPDYWLLMGKINYQLAPGWQAFIQAKNMLDENYKTPATVTVLSEGVPNRGREILAGVGWEF